MRIIILSNHDRAVGALYSDALLPFYRFYNDVLHTYLQGTANTFEFSVSSSCKHIEHLKNGNKIAFVHNNRHYYLNIVDTKQTETELTVMSYAGSLELINQKCGSYTGTSQSFVEYVNQFDKEHVLTIGLNEVSASRVSIEWTGDESLLARLFSIAKNFKAEIELVPELNNDYSLKTIIVNVFKEHTDDVQGIGQKRTDKTLRYGKNIDSITKNSNITNLYTKIIPVGRDGLDLKSIAGRVVRDEDGTILYRVEPDGSIAAVKAMQLFPSTLHTDDGYISSNYSYDTDNVETLYGNALSELKKNSQPETTYEISGYIDANLGDTYNVVDEEFVPPLYLSARVIEQEISFTAKENNKTVFSNFVELNTKLSDDITKRVQELIEAYPVYRLEVSSSRGDTFTDTDIDTTLTANIYRNNTIISYETATAEGLRVVWVGSDGSEYTGETVDVLSNDKTITFRATLEG